MGRSRCPRLRIRTARRRLERLSPGACWSGRRVGWSPLQRAIRFFFQAEDGIRDYKVTGVQTCALPISAPQGYAELGNRVTGILEAADHAAGEIRNDARKLAADLEREARAKAERLTEKLKIGRASCRERV